MAPETVHLQPTAPLASRALLPCDPGMALALAQALLREPKMFNHSRGLWGYTGTAADGQALTVQSTGIGGPSAAVVLDELCDLGLRAAIRIGTCAGLDGGLALGDMVAAEEALCADGASRALGASDRVLADRALTAGLVAGGAHPGVVVSSDLFYARDRARPGEWRRAGALALDMESAALMAVGTSRDVRVASVLGVACVEPRRGRRQRLDQAAIAELGQRLGALAGNVLAE